MSCPKFFLLIRTDKAVEYFSYKESCAKLDKYINITNWKGIRILMKKYGISQKEMLHILETHEVVYSDAAGVILVDEDSLICAQATDSKGLAGKCSAKSASL